MSYPHSYPQLFFLNKAAPTAFFKAKKMSYPQENRDTYYYY